MSLNISELKYIAPAVLYNWRIERWTNRKGNLVYFWQGDPLFPVRIGKTMEKLLSNGFMERLDIGITCYRPTHKAQSLKCGNCHNGKIFDGDKDIGDCPVCKGIGLKEPTNEQ